MYSPQGQEPSRQRDGWVTLGLIVSATSAALTSFDGLRQLAIATGWTALIAPLLPLTVDSFAATATRVWLAKSTGSERARRFSRACAIGAILLSLGGNAAFHLVAANLIEVTWIVVLAVGAIPPVVLGLISHMAVLRTQRDIAAADEESAVLSPVISMRPVQPTLTEEQKPIAAHEKAVTPVRLRPGAKRKATVSRYANEDQLLQAARAADAEHREAHDTGITRDGLRRALRIGNEPATALLRKLKQGEAETAEP